ncbi:uncharacterized protein SPSK_00136 [Sporothrix schenckii 1099-18]|uniref:Uncharacterized protein n=2 Tax=Sporothrix schenckii TaxID=29908 RepID=U7PJL3_SPOS1|nr:uncharacterized protein SPSK_00136 [Sporothrix schenckii 1099-18]ERS95742.1 hypothetical protein HMPREF1624_07817 [Sporothrix schenckii ATCC 58251]KJR83760.1 hypothetical protein SPSK_00136 [Sporothrix schenckii 1099-18]
MPHKHTRRDQDASIYDLPPDRIARPLPTKPAKTESAKTSTTKSSKAKGGKGATATSAAARRKREANKDSISASTKASHDTPRAFRRLMSLTGGKRVRQGLDTGVVETKKQKKQRLAKERAAAAAAAATTAGGDDEEAGAPTTQAAGAAAAAPPHSTSASASDAAPTEALTIRPGERLSEFASRVDAALPLAGLVKSSTPGGAGGKDPLGIAKTYRTKQERKLHKLYDQWRLDDARIKEREAEAREEAEEREAELDETLGVKWRLDFQQGLATKQGGGANGKKKKKQLQTLGGSANNYGAADDDDVWAAFNRKKAAATQSTVRAGVHGTVAAPPELTKIDSSKFKFAQQKKAGGGQGSAEVAAAVARLKVGTSAKKGVNRRLGAVAAGRVTKPGERARGKGTRVLPT